MVSRRWSPSSGAAARVRCSKTWSDADRACPRRDLEAEGVALTEELAGAVNVLRNAQRLTGEQRLAGFIGGLHLTGGIFEPIIKPTVDAFVAAGVGRVLPAHCTGWKAVHQLARVLPDAFVQPAVGTVITF